MTRRPLFALLTASLAFLTGALLVEIALRLLPGPDSRAAAAEGMPTGYYQADPDLGLDLAPSVAPHPHRFGGTEHPIFTNRFQCFDEREGFDGGYILLLGDSMTWGYAPYPAKWGTLLEQELGFPVAKCGVAGCGTAYQVLKGQKTVERIGIVPELVLVGYSYNDVNDDLVPFARPVSPRGDGLRTFKSIDFGSGHVEYFTPDELDRRYRSHVARQESKARKALRALRDSSLLARGTSDLLGRWRASRRRHTLPIGQLYDFDFRSAQARQLPWVARAWANHFANIRAMREWAEALGSELLFVLISDKESTRLTEVRDFLEAESIAYVDLLEEFQRWLPAQDPAGGYRKLFWERDAHWNVAGNLLASLVVADRLLGMAELGVPEAGPKRRRVAERLEEFELD
jgi:hypothetical protein